MPHPSTAIHRELRQIRSAFRQLARSFGRVGPLLGAQNGKAQPVKTERRKPRLNPAPRRALKLQGPRSAECLVILAFLTMISTGVSCSGGIEDTDTSGRRVTAEEFGDEWPFTVQEGYLDCLNHRAAVFRTSSVTYALNGAALDRGVREVDPIWKADPSSPGGKMGSLAMMRGIALMHCE